MIKNNYLMSIAFFISGASVADIKEVADGVYAGISHAPNGEAVYFGLERIDKENFPIWSAYKASARRISENWLRGINVLLPRFTDDLSEETGLNREEYEAMLGVMRKNKKKLSWVFGIGTGGLGAGYAGSIIDESGQTHIAYASKAPVTGRFKPKIEVASKDINIKKFLDAYDDILMTVDMRDIEDSPFTQHRGIFRNPMGFVSGDKRYAGIAMVLHSFAGAAALQHLHGKKYVWVNPIPQMSDILKNGLQMGDMFIGSNRTGIEDERFPPILFEDRECNSILLAKEGTNLADFKEGLPSELIDFKSKPGQPIANVTGLDGNVHLVKLEALSRLFCQ